MPATKDEQLTRRLLRRFGYDIVRYEPTSHPLARSKRLLDVYGTNVYLDVGAHAGESGIQLRMIGYSGGIVSFEPQSSAYEQLAKRASSDNGWKTFHCALGAEDGTAEMGLSGAPQSSSLLDILDSHVEALPGSEFVGKETIEVKALDSVFDTICSKDDRVFLKLDTQGYERHVLDGAKASLGFIDTVQLEMSLVPLYEDETPFLELFALMNRSGYQAVAIEPGFSDPRTGQMLQVNGIFHRS